MAIQTLSEYARNHAEAHPERVAISGDGRVLTYASLLSEAKALAASLQELGMQEGDVLSFQIPNWVEAAVVNLAADLIGAVCNPIVPIYREGELAAILSDAGTRCFFVPGVWNSFDYAGMAEELQRSLPALQTIVRVRASSKEGLDYESLVRAGRERRLRPANRGPHDRKLLLFTSGTTGRAKGVLHSQASLTAPLVRAMKVWNLGEGGCVLMPSPVTHVTGYCCGLEMPLFLGTRTVLMERWNAQRAVELIDSERAEATVGATPFLKELIDAAEAAGSRLPSFRVFACGGASVPPALIRRAAERISGRAFRVYGASEAPLVTLGCAAGDALEVAADTDGRLNGYDVRIVDAVTGASGAEEGEILVRGEGLFLGYLAPQDNDGAFTEDGYFRTGDLGRMDGDALTITGRKKDLIIRGGENISAKEIEDVLLRDPRIREAAAVSMPHARLGETVCLFAVLVPEAQLSLEDVASILSRAGLARQKFPERLIVVDRLPTTPSGKVRKDLLRRKTWGLDESYVRGAQEGSLCHQTIGEVFDEAVRRAPKALALVSMHQNRRLTYEELAKEVDAVAAGFRAIGVKRGDRVGLWSPNCIEWIVVQLATARIGAILVTINPAYRVLEVEHALNLTGCKVLVLAERFKASDYVAMLTQLAPEISSCEMGNLQAKRLPALRWVVTLGEQAPPQFMRYGELASRGRASGLEPRVEGLKPGDDINIQFTSGTTGLPKGATLTHLGILNNGITVGRNMRFGPNDRLCLPVPLYHCFGMVMGVLNCVAHGAAVVLPSDSFDPKAVLRAIAAERCTALYGVPTMFIAELNEPEIANTDLSSLRTGIMAGAPCPIEVMKRVMSEMHMPDVVICYGMTETSPVSFQTGLDASIEHRVATVGKILPHLEAKVVDSSGNVLPRGERGELLVRGYSVMSGYWNDPARTSEAIDKEGWMHTGDIATIDDDGYCRIVGRCKDMIIRGGENVYPAEIEQHLYAHPDIAQAAVFGVPDDKWGEIVCAWIVPKEGRSLSPEDVRNFCTAHIAHYKVPAHVRIVTQMPTTVTGKLQKYLMRRAMCEELGLTDREV